MRYPVPFRILAIGLLTFSLQVHAVLSKEDARKDASCKTNNQQRESFTNAFDKTWDKSSTLECNKLKADVGTCCGSNANCATVMQEYGPIAPGTDEVLPPECTGMNDVRKCQKAELFRRSREQDRTAALCRAIAQSCNEKCGNNACNNGVTYSETVCGHANTNLKNSEGMNPADTAQQPPPTGGDPNQGTPGQAPTQKPGGNMASGLQQAAGALLPALMQAMQEDEPSQQPQSFQSQTCAENPNLAGCVTNTNQSDSWNKSNPAGVEAASAEEPGGDMNVASSDGVNPTYNGNGEQKFGTPASNAAIPNGGGQMPGQNGAGGANGGQTTGGFGIASKAATDIMHGMMGGGFSAMNANMPMQNGAGGGFGGYGQGAQEFKPGMDLRAFLPGGKQDPTRKVAGGAASFQIQPQTVNIWSRISERFKARCNQGLLRDCNGQ